MGEQGAGQDTKEQSIPLGASLLGSSGPDKILINKKVYLFASTDMSDLEDAVAKAIVLSINQTTSVYNVRVVELIKQEAILPHPDGALKLISDAVNESIAWPSNQMKVY